MKPTKERIEKLVKALQQERDRLPEYSAFGDNNWEVLDNQIQLAQDEINDIAWNFDDAEFDDILCELANWLLFGDDKSDFGNDYEV